MFFEYLARTNTRSSAFVRQTVVIKSYSNKLFLFQQMNSLRTCITKIVVIIF